MSGLEWFTFRPTGWLIGKINSCSDQAQSRFIRLMSYYWLQKCSMTYAQALDNIFDDEQSLQELIRKKVVKRDGENIRIGFLDEQYEKAWPKYQQKIEAGKASAEKRRLERLAKSGTASNERSTNVEQALNERSTNEPTNEPTVGQRSISKKDLDLDLDSSKEEKRESARNFESEEDEVFEQKKKDEKNLKKFGDEIAADKAGLSVEIINNSFLKKLEIDVAEKLLVETARAFALERMNDGDANGQSFSTLRRRWRQWYPSRIEKYYRVRTAGSIATEQKSSKIDAITQSTEEAMALLGLTKKQDGMY